MRILLVKTSSLGDVIHNLPVASDIRAALPQARIDWAVEEGFAAIPRLHPAIDRVIPVALRRWRKSLASRATLREIAACRAALRTEAYDAIIDTQGLIKSALVACQARGRRCGFDAASTREPLAALCQSARFAVPRTWHAVDRNRALAAAALGHAVPPGLDYGLGAVSPSLCFDAPCVTLLTATSRDDKLWAEAHWIALGCHLAARGLTCLLPAGSAVERARAARIAAAIPQAQTLPPSDLTTLAGVLAGSRFVVGVDTGLVHLAAALERPVVALFCASEPGLTGVLAARDAINLGARGAPPSPADVIAATDGFAA